MHFAAVRFAPVDAPGRALVGCVIEVIRRAAPTETEHC